MKELHSFNDPLVYLVASIDSSFVSIEEEKNSFKQITNTIHCLSLSCKLNTLFAKWSYHSKTEE